MTEIFKSNRQKYLDLVKDCWNFDDESMSYIEKRLSDEWEPVPELKKLIGINGSKYEDQRIIFDLDMSNENVQSFFESNDDSYRMFKGRFAAVIRRLNSQYNCPIGYKEFIENRVVFKKNITKIKKVFETVYAEFPSAFEADASRDYDKTVCANFIVKEFERIGSCKKSAKKLQFVISFNPIDWLMSSTGENWSSCFNINNTSGGGYQYCLGLPFLCGDKNRMLLYITDGSTKECMGIQAHHYQTRTWCILNETDSFNIVKWYPNDTIGVKPVNSITGLSTFKDRDSFTKGKYPIDVLSTRKGAVIGVYSDMGRLKAKDDKLWLIGNGKEGQQLFTKNLIDLTRCTSRNSYQFNEMESLKRFGITRPGYRIPDWKNLGLHVDLFFPSLKCACGSREKGGFLIKNRFLCYDCYKEKVFVCDNCGSEDYNDKGSHVVETCTGEKIKLCDACWENRSSHTCSLCGKYSTSSLLKTDDGELICKSCFTKHGYSACDECMKVSKKIKYNYNSLTKSSKKLCYRCNEQKRRDMYEVSTFGRYFYVKTWNRPRGMNQVE